MNAALSTPEALVEALQGPSPSYKRAEVDAVVANATETAPLLLALLDGLMSDPDTIEERLDPNDFGPLYAFVSLSQLRYEAAHDTFVRIARLPTDAFEVLLAEGLVTEGLTAPLVRTAGGRTDGLRAIVLDDDADNYIRAQAAEALAIMVHRGHAERGEVLELLSQVMISDSDWPSFLPAGMLAAMFLLGAVEYSDLIAKAFDEDLVDPVMFGDLDDTLDDMEKERRTRAGLQQASDAADLNDVHRSMSWWYCFSPEAPRLGGLAPASAKDQRQARARAEKRKHANRKQKSARKRQRRKK